MSANTIFAPELEELSAVESNFFPLPEIEQALRVLRNWLEEVARELNDEEFSLLLRQGSDIETIENRLVKVAVEAGESSSPLDADRFDVAKKALSDTEDHLMAIARKGAQQVEDWLSDGMSKRKCF